MQQRFAIAFKIFQIPDFLKKSGIWCSYFIYRVKVKEFPQGLIWDFIKKSDRFQARSTKYILIAAILEFQIPDFLEKSGIWFSYFLILFDRVKAKEFPQWPIWDFIKKSDRFEDQQSISQWVWRKFSGLLTRFLTQKYP